MKSYYYNKDVGHGPVTEQRLKQMYAEGMISANMHILEEGTDNWVRYQDVFLRAPATARSAKPLKTVYHKISNESAKYAEKISDFDYNGTLDPMFQKVLPLPSCLATEQSRSSFFTFAANAGSMLCWLAIIVFSLSILSKEADFSDYVTVFLISLIVGFFVQKLFYHCYKLTTESILAKRVQLGSLDFPRIGMVLALIMALVSAAKIILVLFSADGTRFMMFLTDDSETPLLGLSFNTLFYILMAMLFAHALRINATLVKNTLTPGLYFVNILRYLVTTTTLAIQILIPIFFAIFIAEKALPEFKDEDKSSPKTSFRSYSERHSERKRELERVSMESALFILPLMNLVLLFGASVPLDIITSLMSNNAARRREDELPDEEQ